MSACDKCGKNTYEKNLEMFDFQYSDKVYFVCPSCVDDFGFEHEDTWITDPTISECGRFKVDPEYYGVTVEELL